MADGYATFTKQMKTSGKLHEMLSKPNLTPEQLFEVPYISGDINQNIQTFLRFCLKKREFTTKMIKICLNSTYQELQSVDLKRVAQYSIEVLTNDQNALSAFLFSNEQDTWGLTKVIKPEQQAMTSIESEAERLFNDNSSPKIQQANWEVEKDAFGQYELLEMALTHLRQQQKNDTCLGYIYKFCESVLKKSTDQFLYFLQQNSEYLNLFLKHLNQTAIGAVIVLILASEDRTKVFKHEEFKKKIFSFLIEYSFQNIENNQKFEGYMLIVEEVLNTAKQSYFQFFDDFKRGAATLVSQETLRKYYKILERGEKAFGNGARYLEHILRRINSESEQHDYYRQSQVEPTMNFQHEFFYNEFENLIDLIGVCQNYNSMSRFSYLGFVMSLLKNMQYQNKQPSMSRVDIFKKIIQHYQREKAGGLVKNYLFQLLKYVSKKFKENEPSQIAMWLIDAKIEHELIVKLFDDGSTINNLTNSNSTICFILSLLFDIQNKENTFLGNYAKSTNVQLTNAYEKYRTKLANYDQDDDASPQCDDPEFLNFKVATQEQNDAFLGTGNEDKLPEENQQKEPQVQVVGKNNVVIPVLNLPNKNEGIRPGFEETHAEEPKSASQLSRQELIKDLKSTKFELPERLKPKKLVQEQRKTEVKKQLILQSQLPQQKLEHKNLPTSEVKVQSSEQKIQPKPIVQHSAPTCVQKYFIQHLLLY